MIWFDRRSPVADYVKAKRKKQLLIYHPIVPVKPYTNT